MSEAKKTPTRSDESVFVWVTKYALTEGVHLCKVKEFSGDYAYVEWPGMSSYGIGLQVTRKDWHETLELAQERAKFLAAKKMSSLEKHVAKMRKIARDGAKVVEDK